MTAAKRGHQHRQERPSGAACSWERCVGAGGGLGSVQTPDSGRRRRGWGGRGVSPLGEDGEEWPMCHCMTGRGGQGRASGVSSPCPCRRKPDPNLGREWVPDKKRTLVRLCRLFGPRFVSVSTQMRVDKMPPPVGVALMVQHTHSFGDWISHADQQPS